MHHKSLYCVEEFKQHVLILQEHNAVSKECAEKVHELIKQRALDVNLNPDLEKACRHDLGEFCSLSPHHEGTVRNECHPSKN